MTRLQITVAGALLLCLGSLAGVAGCHIWTASTDGLTAPVTLPPTTEQGMLIALSGFDAYVGRRTDMRVVGGDGTIVTHVRLERLPAPSYRLELGSVPFKPDSHVDVIVDMDWDGQYTPGVDAVWQVPLSATRTATIRGEDRRESIIEPTRVGGDFELRLSGFGHLEGQVFRLALTNFVHQITGLFTGTVTGGSFVVNLPQIVVDTQPYTISFYADSNGNNRYDTPPVDSAWRLFTVGEPDGISLDFSYHDDYDDLDFEPR